MTNLRSRVSDKAWYRLTAHFFVGLFDFGVLSEAGSDAFQRVLIGVIAVMLTFGLLLARMFMSAVSRHGGLLTPAPYRASLETLVIAFPMLIVAFTTLLVSHSLFPDETDFRVLLVLPVSRRTVFLSKLGALALFAGIFIVASHVAMLPLFAIISGGRQVQESFPVRFTAHMVASLSGSMLVVLALTGINGTLLLVVPRNHLQAASTAVRSVLLCALVLSLPFFVRLPAIAPLLAAGSASLYLAPPVWFLAIDELLLGHASPYFVRLAAIAVTVFAAAALTAGLSYAVLYRRFDRVMMRPAGMAGKPRWWSAPLFDWALPRRPHVAAVRMFTRLTLGRSPLHQGVFIAIAACGAGLLVNSLFGVKAMPRLRRTYEDELASALAWAPFALMFAMTIAVRAALVLPIEPRANWVFRMTEHDEARVDQIRAVIGSMVHLGVVVPLALLLPVEWMIYGPRAIPGAGVVFMAGLVLVELEMGEWRRIPFTCSYMPGKRFVGLTMLIGFASFVAFTSIGSLLLWTSRVHPLGSLVFVAILGAVVWERRRRRTRLTRHTPLLFEDALPTEIEPLQLSAY
jgi:hypothetical protein